MKKVISLGLMLLLLAFSTMATIGVAPAIVLYDGVLVGEEYTRTINLQNTDEPEEVVFSIDDPDNWFEGEGTYEVPPEHLYIPLKVNVPKKTPAGTYEFDARVEHYVGFKIKVVVTDEKTYFPYVDYILTKDICPDQPLIIKTYYENGGNVYNKVRVEVDISNGESVSVRYDVDEFSSRQLLTFYDATELQKGYYTADVRVYYQDKGWNLIEEKNVHFTKVDEMYSWC